MQVRLTLPRWLNWLIPPRIYADLERRSALTGSAVISVSRRGKLFNFGLGIRAERV